MIARWNGAKPRGVVRREEIRTVEDACPYGFVQTTRKAAWGGAEGRWNTSSVTHSRATFPRWGRQKYSALFDKTFCG